MHPTKIILIYAKGNPQPINATVVYNDEEVARIEKEWNDGYHRTKVMVVDYSIRGE